MDFIQNSIIVLMGIFLVVYLVKKDETKTLQEPIIFRDLEKLDTKYINIDDLTKILPLPNTLSDRVIYTIYTEGDISRKEFVGMMLYNRNQYEDILLLIKRIIRVRHEEEVDYHDSILSSLELCKLMRDNRLDIPIFWEMMLKKGWAQNDILLMINYKATPLDGIERRLMIN